MKEASDMLTVKLTRDAILDLPSGVPIWKHFNESGEVDIQILIVDAEDLEAL